VKVRIYNSAGEEVYALAQDLGAYHVLSGVQAGGGPFVPDAGGSISYLLLGTDNSFTWDGRNAAGQYVASGSYSVVFEQPSFSGPPALYTASATVLRAGTDSAVDIYNSAGERVRHFNVPLGQASYLRMDATFVPDAASPGLKIRWGEAAAEQLLWDGLDERGQRVSSGVYQVRVTQVAAGASSTLYSAFVTVLEAPSEPLQGLVAAPNPLSPTDGAISVRAPSLGATGRMKVGLYNFAGELIVQGSGVGPRLDLSLPTKLAGGVYLLVVEAQGADGASARKVLKAAVVR
jgi:hypothetical protein